MVEIIETPAEKMERKRLKKLAKLASINSSSAKADVDSPSSSDAELLSKKLDETPAERKERKRLKKLQKLKALDESGIIENGADQDSKKDKKKKDIVTAKVANTEKVSAEKQSDKKSKKRKALDWNEIIAEDEASATKENKLEPNAWSKIMSQQSQGEKKKDLHTEPPVKKKKVKETEKVTHAQVEEEKGTFRKIFYKPTEATLAMPDDEVAEFRVAHKMNITGRLAEIYKPLKSFDDFCLDKKIMSVCKDFSTPTPIQAQCWPIIASGRDIIGIAETGSGKTLAFSLPAIAHMLHRYENPIKGVPKWEQKRALRWGVEVVVATPGRLKDLVNMGCVSLAGVSYLVLDEADRMLDQGFEDDIREIIGMTHKERQTCLFSATWPEAIRKLAQEFLTDPVKVTVGSDDLSANKRIKQIVEVIDERDKPEKLMKVLETYSNKETKNRMIIFVMKKTEAHELEYELRRQGFKVRSIHGDKSQADREYALNQFKSGYINLLVATDVAARGLDIPDVEFVINYSFPQTIEDYVHRIGRTGRAGKDGVAHSFFHRGDSRLAGCLVKVLKDAGQEVPQDMYKFDLRIRAATFNKFFNRNGDNEAPRQCFKCGDTGHMSRFCPQGGGGGGGFRGRGGRGGGRGGGTGGSEGCFKCGESGHFSRECPKSGGGGRGNFRGGRGFGRGKGRF